MIERMQNTPYTPSTLEIKHVYTTSAPVNARLRCTAEEFSRWLHEYTEEVFEQGYAAGLDT